MNILPVILILAFSQPTPSQADKDKKSLAAYDKFEPAQRAKLVKAWQYEFRSTQNAITILRESYDPRYADQLQRLREKLARLRKNDPPYLGDVDVIFELMERDHPKGEPKTWNDKFFQNW